MLMEAVGLAGAALLLVPFWAVTSGRWSARGVAYPGLTAAGSLVLAAYALARGAWVSAAVNLVFVAIGAFGAARAWKDTPAAKAA